MTPKAKREGETMISFKNWVESIGTNCLVLSRRTNQAKIDRPGWFSGQWFDIPDNVLITDSEWQSHAGI